MIVEDHPYLHYYDLWILADTRILGERRRQTGRTISSVSIPVSLDELRAQIRSLERDPYLLTVSEEASPHCVAVVVSWVGDELVVRAGNRTLENASARSSVSFVWPPTTRDGYSLIVDGSATATGGTGEGDNTITVRPTRAVLHRPAARDTEAAGAGSDCISVLAPE
jgi:hypothetical protein